MGAIAHMDTKLGTPALASAEVDPPPKPCFTLVQGPTAQWLHLDADLKGIL